MITEDFEKQEASDSYNTQHNYEASASNAGISWFVEHGSVSESNPINGNNSLVLRANYAAHSIASEWKSPLPYAETKTPVNGLRSVSFKTEASHSNLEFAVFYSTDGTLWTSVNSSDILRIDDVIKFNIPLSNIYTGYYIKIAVSSKSNHANDPNTTGSIILRIDDVVFTYSPSFDATISTSGLTTVCLPFNAEFNDEAKTAGAKAWAVTGIDGESLHLTEVDALKAGRGYILQGEESSTVKLVECTEPAEDNNLLKGVTARTAVSSLGIQGSGEFGYPWILNKSNEFVKYTGEYIPDHKAYLDGKVLQDAGLSLSSASLRLDFDGMEDGNQTAISSTSSYTQEECPMYDLFGRKSNGNGFAVMKGRVILVK